MWPSQRLGIDRSGFSAAISRARSKNRRGIRPIVTLLEGRTLLSTVPITVTSLADYGTGTTLRAAITTADAGSTSNQYAISFTPGLTGTINLGGSLPYLSNNISITGPGASSLTVNRPSNEANSSIFTVYSGETVNISDITISGGHGNGLGGGIYNGGILTVTNSTISDNTSVIDGGGIYNGGTLTVTNSTISNNTTQNGSGGGIYNGGILTMINSTINNNTSQNGGGGIYNMGIITMINSTISSNACSDGFGGGIFDYDVGILTVTNSTISDNTSVIGYGGGIYNGIYAQTTYLTLNNTIVAGNTGNDIYGPVNPTSAYNLIGNGGSGTTNLSSLNSTNLIGTTSHPINPDLGLLQNNGGPTETMALLPGSPAIGTGNVTLAVDQNGTLLTTDQRGAGYPRTINGHVDIGAYEFTPLAQTIAFGTLANQTYGVAPITLTATATSNLPVSYTVISGSATISGSVLTITGAGLVNVQAHQAGDATYAAATPVNELFIVIPAMATVSVIAIPGIVYNGTSQETAIYFAFGVNGVVLPSGDFTDTTVHTNAGTCTDTWIFSDPNYIYRSGTVTDIIIPAQLTITARTSTKTFDGTTTVTDGATPSITGLVGTDTVTGLSESFASLNAGSEAIQVNSGYVVNDSNGGNNYVVTVNPGAGLINQAPLTVTGNSATMTYGGVIPTFTTSILPSGVTETTTIVDPVYSTSNNLAVGTYNLDTVLSGAGLSNYNPTVTDGTFQVTPASVTGSFTASDKPYDGTTTATVTATSLSSISGDNVQLTYTGATFAAANVGLQPVAITNPGITGSDAGDYTLVSVALEYATINQAPLTITANNASGNYGVTPVLNGVSYTGFVDGQTLSVLTTLPTVTTTATSTSPVGSYPITVTGAVDSNYAISYEPGTYTVTPAALTVTAGLTHHFFRAYAPLFPAFLRVFHGN